MAVAFDSVGPSSSGANNATSPLSWTHTIGGSANALLVGVNLDPTNSSVATISVTAGGTSMGSPVVTGVISGGGGFTGAALWVFQMLNPPTGSVSIVVTVSGSETFNMIIGGSLAFTGAGGFGTPATANGQSASQAVTVSGTSSASLVAGFLSAGDAISSATSPATSRYINNAEGSSGNTAGDSAGATSPGGGAVTIGWSVGGSTGDTWAAAGIEVQASVGTPGPALGQQVAAPRPALIPVVRGWRNAGHSR